MLNQSGRLNQLVKTLAHDLGISEKKALKTLISKNGNLKKKVKSRITSIYSPTNENLNTIGSLLKKKKKRKTRKLSQSASLQSRKSILRSSKSSKRKKFKTINASTHASTRPRDIAKNPYYDSIVPINDCDSVHR